jgi:hypothetical protein
MKNPPRKGTAADNRAMGDWRSVVGDDTQTSSGLKALLGFPTKVRARLLATLAAVAQAPPKRFAGGGQWEAMHGDMTGYFEARVTSTTPNGKWHYRLLSLLDDDATGGASPLLTVIMARRSLIGRPCQNGGMPRFANWETSISDATRGRSSPRTTSAPRGEHARRPLAWVR